MSRIYSLDNKYTENQKFLIELNEMPLKDPDEHCHNAMDDDDSPCDGVTTWNE